MNRSVGLPIIAASLALWPNLLFAQGKTPNRYDCLAAKNLTVIAAWEGDGVLIVERSREQECRVSINGAPAGTPPLDRVLTGWNSMRQRGFGAPRNFTAMQEELGYALSAASPYETIHLDFSR